MGETPERVRRGRDASNAYRGRMLALVAVCSLLSVGGRSLFSPLLPAIIEDLSLTPSAAGVALSVMTGLSAVCRYPGGRLADQLSRKTVLVPALATMTVGFVGFAVAVDYRTFLVAAVVVGLGAGLYLPAAFALLSDLFVDRRGTAIGVNNAAVNLGGILAAGVAFWVLARTSWRVAFLPVVPLFAASLLAMHRWNAEPYERSRVRLDVRATARRLLARLRIRWMVLSAALVMFVQHGTLTFVPLYLQSEKAFSPFLATVTFAEFFVVGAVATAVTGGIGDRVGHVRAALGATVVASVGLVLLVVGDGPAVVLLGMFAFALGVNGFWPNMNAYVLALFPDESVAGDFGALGTVYLGLGSLGPTYVGVVAESATFGVALAGLVACLVASVAINAGLSRLR